MNSTTSFALNAKIQFGTKAETLERVAPLLEGIECADLYYFSVGQWKENQAAIIDIIQKKFGDIELVIRSSAQGEDSHEASMAGAYKSVLNVSCKSDDQLVDGIRQVINSYNGNDKDQVLVQPMITDVSISGVMMTRNLEDGAPYYVINYDDFSGKTDSITGGIGAHKTVLVSHQCDHAHFDSSRLQAMIKLIQEVERVCGAVPLDIEFGLTNNLQPFLFQVRPISLWENWHEDIHERVQKSFPKLEKIFESYTTPKAGMYGRRSILGIMPDWNPAEMIGVLPDPLASSLYRELITKSVWQQARQKMGYRTFTAELMSFIYDRPYIDVRHSFNSFLPQKLNGEISEKIVNAWLDRLDEHPELHDKVEFDVAQTCVDFSFDVDFQQRYKNVLSDLEFTQFRDVLLDLTNEAVTLTNENTLLTALDQINQLAGRQMNNRLVSITELMEECKLDGTLPFSIIARHAFIAEKILRSAVDQNFLSIDRFRQFKKSMHTITRTMAKDMQKVIDIQMSKEEFLEIYGHLRPGTYDIQSMSYKDRISIFEDDLILPSLMDEDEFELTTQEQKLLDAELAQIGFDIQAIDLFKYARIAIEGREYAKFIFTRNVSNILEKVVKWGASQELSRADLALLPIKELIDVIENNANLDRFEERKATVLERRQLSQQIKLSYIIRGIRDIYVVPSHRSAPNFIGTCRIDGAIVSLDAHSDIDVVIKDKIVCIENADPGYDWIFTKGIKALVTKYGGANSHMAIRCAEFGLPAAIGCGEDTYQRLVAAKYIELNSVDKTLRPIGIES